MPARAHEKTCFLNRVTENFIRPRGRGEIQRALPHQRSEVQLIRLQGNNDETVLWNAEDRALHRLNADDAIRQTANVDLAADRITGREQLAGDVRSDVSHARAAVSFGVYKEAAKLDVAIVDVSRIGSGATDKSVLQNLISAFNFGRSSSCLRADFADQRRFLFQVIVVIERQFFVATLRGGDRVGVFKIFERIKALDRKRFCADAGNLFVDIDVKTLN